MGSLDSFHEMLFCLILGCDQVRNELQLKIIMNDRSTLTVRPSVTPYLEAGPVLFVQGHHFVLASLGHVVFRHQYPASIKALLEYFFHLCTCDALYIQSDEIPSTMVLHHFYLKFSFTKCHSETSFSLT